MNTVEKMNIIVTGGASGIGRATAGMLSERGASVMIADRDHARVEEMVLEIRSRKGSQNIAGCTMDVRLAADCERMMRNAEEQFGELDAVVHCAGILRSKGSRPRPVHDIDETEYDEVMGINLKGTFLVNRAALQTFMPKKRGQIINLSSTSGQKGRPLDGIYSASKAGIIALTESIAEEVRAFGIRVLAIIPDAVDTPLWTQNGGINAAPQGALPAERVAEVILMILSLPPDILCENLVVAPMRLRTHRNQLAVI
ncbi:MAG: SDR family oxidoreductase [Methylococcales bacterium]